MKHITRNIEHKDDSSFAKQNKFFLFHVTCSMLRANNRGFSLMEVMVVMSIVVVGLLGVSSLSMQNIQVQNLNDEELIASMLAQEGIELVRNIRDRNWITETYDQWRKDIAPTAAFVLDYDDNVPITTPLSAAEYESTRLYLKNNFYAHDNSGTQTTFHRYFVTENIAETSDVNDAIKVTCYVRWRSGGRDQSYDIESHLYHWR